MRTLLRALLLPSILLSGNTSNRPLPLCAVTSSDARIFSSPGLGMPSAFNENDILANRAHSHNDYHQEAPLSSALHHGIKSVEVDVFPRNDELWVGHTRFELDSTRTIDNLYVQPLLNVLRRRRGLTTSDPRVTEDVDNRPFPQSQASFNRRMKASHPNNNSDDRYLMNLEDEALTLLVDFKADPEKSVDLLHKAIEPLRPFLTKVDRRGNFKKGKVTILVSGTRPKDSSLVSGGERFIFIDGRARDITGETDTSVVPMVSLPWRSMQFARLVGRGEQYMRRLVQDAHRQGKRVRIFGAPNRENLWRHMLRSNVDLLSIDDHPRFARFASRIGFYNSR